MGNELSFICDCFTDEVDNEADDLNDWNISARTLTLNELNSYTHRTGITVSRPTTPNYIPLNATSTPESKPHDNRPKSRPKSKSISKSTETQKRPKRPSKKPETEDVSSFSSRLLLFEDVADLIMKKLSKPDLHKARRVCQLWNKIALKELKKFPCSIVEVNYENFRDFDNHFRVSKNKWLCQNLKFKNWSTFKAFYWLNFNVSPCPFYIKKLYLTVAPINLIVHTFRNQFLPILSKFSPQLEVLSLDHCNWSTISAEHMKRVNLTFPKLQSLHFSPSCPEKCPEIFEKIVSNSPPQLSTLVFNFDFCSNRNQITCTQYLNGLSMVAPNLRTLALYFSGGNIVTNNFGTTLLKLAKDHGLTELTKFYFWIEDNNGQYFESFDEIRNLTKFLNYQKDKLELLLLNIKSDFVVNLAEVAGEEISILPKMPKLKELVYFTQLQVYCPNAIGDDLEEIFYIFKPLDASLLFTSELKILSVLGFVEFDGADFLLQNYPQIVGGSLEFWAGIEVRYEILDYYKVEM